MGPGVTPDVMWEGAAPAAYDPSTESQSNSAIEALHDALCKPN
jgi:hypothetical protein